MKMEKANVFARALSCALAVAMLCTVCVFAATKTDSDIITWGFGTSKFEVYSALYADTGSKWRAATWVHVQDNQSVPAGYIKAKAFLYDATGNLCKSTTLQANTAESKYLFVITPALTGTGEYYTIGEVSLYSDPEFRASRTLMTTNMNSSAMAGIQKTLDKDGNYPVNAQGQSYGSALLANVLGYKPDLIAAIGTNNVKGYVRMDELDPYTATPAETAALTASAKDSVLPLYDLNGKVIGTFVQNVGASTNGKEFKGSTFDAARTKVAAGSYTTAAQTAKLPKTEQELTALAQSALTTTPYSRNSKGQTYGSESMSGAVGYSPDLISVVATNGTSGYAKKTEFYFACQHAPQDPASGVISVYDLDGKVVGEYKIEVGQSSNDPEFAGLSVEEVREKLIAG